MTVAPLDTNQSGIQQLDGRLRDLLAGKKIVMTGVTGFIGEQLLWKILTELPDTTPAVLVRRKGSATARDRMMSAIKKPIFSDLRDAAGGAAELLDSRIEVIEGDLPNVPELPADLDIVVHCAGDVSFDPPIDQALTTNVIGTKALMDRMLQAVSDENGDPRTVPHYVHISTAYTAGRRRGAILEAPHVHNIDYEAEAAAGIGDARVDRGGVAYVGAARETAQRGRARASPGRILDHRRRHRAPPPRLGAGRARQGRHRASPLARLDRRLHLHQGSRGAGRGGYRPGHPCLDREAGHC